MQRRRIRKFTIIILAAASLTSCGASYDVSEVSTMGLCEIVLNYDFAGMQVEELARRGEDCSNFMHLRRPVSSEVNVNVEQQ
jgi:hypothetical protein|tara:strand:- start:338 stop:583 length:246 start_codon:yes stop_codon:yes gene_type:complete